MPLSPNDKLKNFPTTYNDDIIAIQEKLFLEANGESGIKYTGTTTLSGDLVVTGDISGSFKGTIEASNVLLEGGGNVETEFSTIINLNNSILDQARDFERRAEQVRKITPSGFTKFPINVGTEVLSDAIGLNRNSSDSNYIHLGHIANVSNGYAEVNINGYSIKIIEDINDVQLLRLPAPPTTGTRQDLVFIEAWKEEVDKETGLFFPFGNTQYSSSIAIDGTNLSQVQAGYTGSAYFTSNNGVYCVRANSITEAFIANTDNNIGILDNGNFFQIRYRIRVEAGFTPNIASGKESIEYLLGESVSSDYDNSYAPQGQLALAPARGLYNTTPSGAFFNQSVTFNQPCYHLTDDNGVYVGALWSGAPISGLSLDGFTYAIPICAVHRRNTGVYSLANQNGTAFDNGYIIDIAPVSIQTGMLVTSNGSTFHVKYASSNGGTILVKLVRTVGATAPSGTLAGSWAGTPFNVTINSVAADDGTYLLGYNGDQISGIAINARPDSLFSDIIDRRDVLDLRHKVSLSGTFDENDLYEETKELIMKGEYRQEWDQLRAYDADGNGLATIETGIYGNVLLETLGLGATVPDSHINTDVTKKLICNNGIPVGFNGARSVFSDAETNEDYTALIVDQSSPQVLDSADDIVTYNSVSKTITIDMTQHSSYVNDVVRDPTILSGHTPRIIWGNGANVAGVWTKTNDYNWSFEVKQYGSATLTLSSAASAYIGDIYQDSAGKDWKILDPSGSFAVFAILPDYASGNDGGVLPLVGTILTKQSGLGDITLTVHGSTATAYQDGTGSTHLPGYSATHGTSVNESLFTTFKINYKAGSSCLPELPYGGEEVIKGAEVFLDGTKLNMSSDVRCIGYQDASTKTATLLGFAEKRAVVDLGDLGTGVNSVYTHSPSVVYTGGQYVMFYHISVTSASHIIRATSSDGRHFTNHQIVMSHGAATEFDDNGVQAPQVILDGSTWKMWYSGLEGSWSVGYATSTDGISWTKQGQVIAIGFFGGSSTDVLPSAIVKSGSTYYMYCSVYSLQNTGWWVPALATSTDGVTWTNQGQIYQASGNPFDWNYVHVNFLSVIKDGPLWKALVCGRDGQTGYDLEVSEQVSRHKYMISSDGKNWTIAGNWVSERHEAGFDTNYIGSGAGTSASLIKVDNRYEVFYSGYDGANWRIGKMYLAMSQAGATGSSTTGEYTNTYPQINLGFTSNDAVIINYERLASQHYPSTSFTAKDLYIKTGFATTLGTNTGSDTGMIQYANWFAPDHTRYGLFREFYQEEGDIQSIISKTLVSQIQKSEFSDLVYFDTKQLYNLTNFKNIDYFPVLSEASCTNGTNRDPNGFYTTIDGYPSLGSKYSLPNYTTGHRGIKLGVFFQMNLTNGKILIGFNMEHESHDTRNLSHLFSGVLPSPMEAIGRPIIKS